MTLSDREIATLIIFGVFVLWVLWRRPSRMAVARLFKAFLVPQIVVPLVLYLMYAAALVALGWWVGVWRFEMLKDNLLVVLTVAIPMMLSVTTMDSGQVLVRKVIRETLGVAAVVALYVNLASLSLILELLFQVFVIFVSAMSAVAKLQGAKTQAVAKLADGILLVIGLGMLGFTTAFVIQNWSSLDLALIALTAAMSVWLPALLLPYLYVLAFFAAVELILVRLPFFNDRQPVPRPVRLAIVQGLHGSVFLAKRFVGEWLADAGGLREYRSTRELMKRFRMSTRRAQSRPEEINDPGDGL